MPQPDMISGMRPPRTTRMESMEQAAQAAKAPPSPAPSTDPTITVYVSSIRRYRVEVMAPTIAVDPVTGRKTTTNKRITAEFDEGVYRNAHRDPKTRLLIDEELQRNPYFGAFGGGPQVHFWLASDQQERTEAKRIEAALDTLKSLPREQVEQYAAALRQEAGAPADHALPPVGSDTATEYVKKAAVRPIKE